MKKKGGEMLIGRTNKRRIKANLIAACCICLISPFAVYSSDAGIASDQTVALLAARESNPAGASQQATSTKPPAAVKKQKKQTFGDMGSDGTYDPGIDLVVSKVEITKGTFGGASKIQIKPYIKNMWRGRTNGRIKILFHGLSAAIWMEGGIGANAEKLGGAYYIPLDAAHIQPFKFSVVVNNDHAVAENNFLNNSCGAIGFSPMLENHKMHNCPIVGPHEPLM